uniref:Uncharacterized protein n=1 Tax=Oryza sativa subsp. japonica TaxID=39947 RepID=Q2QW20_ORYSJ|nr:hypothetical protein LOC_Os12g10859 [Oryza sativa Japonica Group]
MLMEGSRIIFGPFNILLLRLTYGLTAKT